MKRAGFRFPPAREALRRHCSHGSNAMATVTLKNIRKVYDNKVTAVRDFNLEIADKEFIVLVGPSGCGKSTTLRMVAGLEEITEGDLFIGEKRMNDELPKNRDIAMVFQNYALYPHMTVYDNMAFALKLRKTPKKEIDKKVRAAAEILDITEFLNRKPKALSGGQRQRVAIGRAIVRNPQVFLMDEPLSNLDAKLRNQMRAEIIKLRQRINTTFIYVTHDQTEAMTLGDRIVVMKDGYIMQIGTPQEVFEHPANVFVAGFIGSPQMNFFGGRLQRTGETYQISVADAVIPLTDRANRILSGQKTEDKEVTVGVRPEHVSFARESGPHTIAGKVDVSEMMGSEVYLHVSAAGKDVTIRVPVTDLPEQYRSGIPFGADVNFTFSPELVHLFDPETEESLLAEAHA